MFRNFNNRLSRYNSYNNSFSLTGELKNSVSGKNGELSGILTYIFQHLITSDENIKDALEKISQDEMRHMEMLSNLIVQNGEVPYFVDSANNFFTSRYVGYETNPKIFLMQNIKDEEFAIKNYTRILDNLQDEKTREVIEDIIEDEKNHLDIFRRLLNAYSENENWK